MRERVTAADRRAAVAAGASAAATAEQLEIILVEDNVVRGETKDLFRVFFLINQSIKSKVNEKVLTRMLQSLGQSRIVVFGDAISALQYLKQQITGATYDDVARLVLMDNSMPFLPGAEACKVEEKKVSLLFSLTSLCRSGGRWRRLATCADERALH